MRWQPNFWAGEGCVLTVMYLEITLIQEFTKMGAWVPAAGLPSSGKSLLIPRLLVSEGLAAGWEERVVQPSCPYQHV